MSATQAQSSGKPVLEVHGLTRRFGEDAFAVEAVRGVDLRLDAGEIVLIMGPSGSGKTTLLSMLGALLRPSEGEILLSGISIGALSERQLPMLRAKRIGFIFQDFNLLPSLTARENVEVALNVAGVRGSAAHQWATSLLEQLALAERLDFLPEQLSGGEKQRVAIARALANDPDLVLADEPTANLDSAIGHEVMRRLREIAKRRNQSVLIVSHDDRIRQFVDRVLWLEDGQFKSERTLARDPVCGMEVDPEHAPATATIDGVEYYFCAPGCRSEFESRQSSDAEAAARHDFAPRN
jgi:putative ABC transport system ATP-binding protein